MVNLTEIDDHSTAARTGDDYLGGLRDGRQVWIDGERVADVTEHASLRAGALSMARLYDLQHDRADVMIALDEASGLRVPVSYITTRSAADLERRHRALEVTARATFGQVGRSPDYVNLTLAGFSGMASTFALNGNEQGAQNLRDYHREAMQADYAMTHALVNPTIDRGIDETDSGDGQVVVHKVAETSDSIVVSGARGLATLAPFCDEIFVYPGIPFPKGADKYALSFAVPLNSPGIKILCRDNFSRDATHFDSPFSRRFDEQDAIVVFDNVEIPRNRIFINGDVEIYNNVIRRASWTANIMQQTTIRAHAKLQLAWQLGTLMCEAINHKSRDAQALLGEILSYVELTRAALVAAESQAYDRGGDVWFCDERPFSALRPTLPRWFPRVNEILQLLGGQSLLGTPSQADYENPALRPYLDIYHQGANDYLAPERTAVFRAVWDMIGTSLAGRGELYERFYLGSSSRWMQLNHAAQVREGDFGLAEALLSEAGEAKW